MKKPSDERRWGRRLSWAALAQLASSVTNFALYVGLLASSTTEGFGRWVAVLAVHHLMVALARSLVSEPMVASAGSRPARGQPPERPGLGRALPGRRWHADEGVDRPEPGAFSWGWATGRYRAIGLAGAVGAATVGWWVGADGATVAAVALSLPFLVLQDGFRSLAWARDRPELAVGLDGVWIAVTGCLLAVVVVTDRGSAELVVVCWLVGGLASAVAGRCLVAPGSPWPVPTGGSPPVGRAPAQVLEERLHARRHSQALLTSGRNLLPIAVATVVGPSAAGLLKAALLPYTPILSLLAGLRMVVLPRMQRAAETTAATPGDRAIDRFVTRLVTIHLVVASGSVLATLVVVTAAGGRLGTHDALRPDLLGWGAVIAVMIVIATPLADGIGFGRRPVPVVGRRLAEIAIEWGAVFAAAALGGPDRVVIGWAVGIAVGGLLWLAPGLTTRHDQARERGAASALS
jgi:hypothetical protein